MKNIIIIGNGIAGITAARHIRKRSDHSITVISPETEHFFSRTALMYIYMGHMGFENIKPYEDWFWKKNRIDLVQDHVEQVITTDKTVKLSGGRTISYDILIIATGSKPNKFGWPGQDLIGVQGLYSFQDLQEMETNTIHIKRAVIVGGGLIGIEMAEMLLSRKIEVTFLIRENSFWSNVLPQQEANLISRHVREHHIDLREETELEKILSDENGKVKGVVTKSGEEIDCQFVGLTVGVSPNVAFLKDSGIEIQRGVLVNEYLETNITDVYAIGDCVERTYDLPGRKSIEQVWYTGRMMGEVVAQTICNSRTKYEPGPWFNSAKFLDIEYQTYGNVWNEPKPNEEEFYWEHQGGKKAIHFVWDRDSKHFLGVNVFGIRLRHELFDQWLREKKSIQFVLQNLSSANFDPEFFDRHEKEIVSDFEEKVFEVKSAIA
ncbi:MAG TPA: FAD-dependent oxidoreductase [Cyclobacteriaceae bacterium]|nr:FAD-dependent oxidoreductase [Cyclobacteriaceae bacterium]HRK52864.1 FAD-dependent oxidoreductase [Cyclobacteriaceae bacterium]